MKRHKAATHEDKSYACNQCQFKAGRLPGLVYHKKSVHLGIRYPCKKCDYEAKSKYQLLEHNDTKHKNDEEL